MPDLNLELKFKSLGFKCIGVDEVGRGCIAGPVVSAAVVLPEEIFSKNLDSTSFWYKLNDSKKIVPKQREVLAKFIQENAIVNIAWCDVSEIDSINILHATMSAMRKACEKFLEQKSVILVDGNQNPYSKNFFKDLNQGQKNFPIVETVVGGDSKSLSIAAASIVAKVFRDKWMNEFDKQYPGYGFAKHKGYLTKEHVEALSRLGPSIIHRKSFSPVKEILLK